MAEPRWTDYNKGENFAVDPDKLKVDKEYFILPRGLNNDELPSLSELKGITGVVKILFNDVIANKTNDVIANKTNEDYELTNDKNKENNTVFNSNKRIIYIDDISKPVVVFKYDKNPTSISTINGFNRTRLEDKLFELKLLPQGLPQGGKKTSRNKKRRKTKRNRRKTKRRR